MRVENHKEWKRTRAFSLLNLEENESATVGSENPEGTTHRPDIYSMKTRARGKEKIITVTDIIPMMEERR